MRDGVARIAAAFAQAAPGFEAVTLGEALWLAATMPHLLSGPEPESAEQGGGRASPPADASPDDAPETATPPDDRPRLFGSVEGNSSGTPVSPAAVGTGRAMPATLDLARALRPFKRHWVRGHRTQLDLDATVDAYARTGTLLPVFGPAPERWFDAALVVDTSANMAPWQGVAAELMKLIDHTGAFRGVRRWNVAASGQDAVVQTLTGRQVAPGELRVPDGRRLTFVFSDFSARFWYEAPLWSAIRSWGMAGPTVAVSPLPSRLWRRTGMNVATARVASRRPGEANSALVVSGSPSAPALQRDQPPWMPVPAVALSPSALGEWARVVTHSGSDSCDSLLLPPAGRLARPNGEELRAASISKRLRSFLATAPDAAIQLAVLCTPFKRIELPVLNLLRHVVDVDVTTADVAEVLVSGLFAIERDVDGPLAYAMQEEARVALAARLSKRDIWRSFKAVTRVVESFKALPGKGLVGIDDARGAGSVPDDAQPFAAAHRDLLALLSAGSGRTPQVKTGSPARSRGPEVPSEDSDYGSAFFLSYAHTPRVFDDAPDLNYWVRQFFRDLCNELVSSDPSWHRPTGLPGFMDDNIPEGALWRHRLARELATCRVFVPLYSRSYFSSLNCGKEWAVFRARQMAYTAQTGFPNEAILPVIWKPPRTEDLPEFATDMQMARLGVSDAYFERGLYELIRLDRDREYINVLLGFAELLDQAARNCAPPIGPITDYENVRPLFPGTADRARNFGHPLRNSVGTPDPIPLPSAIRRAVELIERRAAEPLTIEDIAVGADVSISTLQEGFQRYLDITPMSYLRDIRLWHVREDLAMADPALTAVAEIATRWGFTDIGLFDVQYCERFGESPRSTLHS